MNQYWLYLVDETTSAWNAVTYIQPRISKRYLSVNGSTSTREYASSNDYSSIVIAAILKEPISTLSIIAPPVTGQATPAPAIGSRSTGNKET